MLSAHPPIFSHKPRAYEQHASPPYASSQATPGHPRLNTTRSYEAEHQSAAIHGPQSKKRKTDRACDACRRKKTRCDGPWSVSSICTNCAQSNKPCTYIEQSKPRGPPKAYVTGLEDRVEELEALLAQIKPGVDFSAELGPAIARDSWKNQEDRPPSARDAIKRISPTHTPSGAATPPLRQGSTSRTTPSAEPLPPLMIAYNKLKDEDSNAASTSKSKYLFSSSSQRRKTSSSKANSDASNSRHSSAQVMGSDYRSPPLDTSSESESYGSQDEDEDDSDALVKSVTSSAEGRTRYTLKMSELPKQEENAIVFHGRSSTAGLVETARIFKHMHMQETMAMNVVDAPVKQEEDEHGVGKLAVERPDNSRVAVTRRPEFWSTPWWETQYQALNVSSPLQSIPHILAQFPPPDLCRKLIDLYFFHSNSQFPLLHRPTFDRHWEQRLYERNIWHACLCLMTFAIGSRWCEDDRVLPDQGEETIGHDRRKDWTQAGAKYAVAAGNIHHMAYSMFHTPSLFEIQTFTLMGLHWRSTKHSPMAWAIVSIGLRKALNAGAHRKTAYGSKPSADNELWKRAFWHLVFFDRIGSVILGRSIIVGEEDLDLELPLEVDDEFWTGPNAWTQPKDRPSLINSFNHLIRLSRIIAFATKTVYAIDKAKVFRNFIKGDWRVEVTNQLSTAMEEWLVAMPKHLRWSEDMSDPVFYTQAAMLEETYYMTQTLIYRPFIPVPPMLPRPLQRDQTEFVTPTSSPTPFSALAICVKSARKCMHILEAQYRKHSINHVQASSFVVSAFTCAGTLILALWDLKAQQTVLMKVKNAGVIAAPDPQAGVFNAKASSESLKTDALLHSLKQEMEVMVGEIKMLIRTLEWFQDRWGIVALFLAQIRESMPTEKDLELNYASRKPVDTLTLVKQLSFQDLRRQREQAKEEIRLQRSRSQMDLNKQSRSSTPSTLGQWSSKNQEYRSGHQALAEGSYEDIHPQSLGDIYGNARARVEPIDVDRFLQDHRQELHTFADEDLDGSPQRGGGIGPYRQTVTAPAERHSQVGVSGHHIPSVDHRQHEHLAPPQPQPQPQRLQLHRPHRFDPIEMHSLRKSAAMGNLTPRPADMHMGPQSRRDASAAHGTSTPLGRMSPAISDIRSEASRSPYPSLDLRRGSAGFNHNDSRAGHFLEHRHSQPDLRAFNNQGLYSQASPSPVYFNQQQQWQQQSHGGTDAVAAARYGMDGSYQYSSWEESQPAYSTGLAPLAPHLTHRASVPDLHSHMQLNHPDSMHLGLQGQEGPPGSQYHQQQPRAVYGAPSHSHFAS